MHRTLSLCVTAIAAVLLSSGSALAQEHVLRDHLSGRLPDPREPGLDIFSNAQANQTQVPWHPFLSGFDTRAISPFTGDGNPLHTYTAYFLHGGFPDTAIPDWTVPEFRLSFWSSRDHLMTDPEMLNPRAGDREVVLGLPSNADFNVPFDWGWGGFAYDIPIFRFTWNLDQYGIQTILGQEQSLLVQTRSDLDSDWGLSYALSSGGGAGTIGTERGLVWGRSYGGLPPDVTPYAGWADRITTVPAPSAAILLGLTGFGCCARRRRK